MADDADDLQKQFEGLIKLPGIVSRSVDTRVPHAIGALGLAVLRLDKTSSRLGKINIWLAAAMVLMGALQVIAAVLKH
jgi:hypothetical protein